MTAASCQLPAGPPQRVVAPACAVFLLSSGIVGLELALMRCFAVAGSHHFSYLVIATALLGFGASGSLLTLVGRAMERRFELWVTALTLAFGLSVTLSFRAAQALPLDPRYVLYSGRQVAMMAACHLLFFVPFLVGATAVGLSLMHFAGRVHLLYGASLLGGGVGSVAMLLLMFLLPEVALLHAAATPGFLAAVAWTAHAMGARGDLPALCGGRGAVAAGRRRGLLVTALVLCASATAPAALEARWPLWLRVDPYKMLSVARRWEAQSDAGHVLTRRSPRGRVDVYESDRFHYTLFAALTATETPPREMAVLVDGELAGAVFRVRSAGEAGILDYTPMALPYRALERPRVLLLGETAGTNVWLALRGNASAITVVQRDPQIVALLRGPLAQAAGHVLSHPGVRAVAADPRLFLEQTRERYDIIQIARAEGMAAEVSALMALHGDFLLTREGIACCLRRLRPRGILSITRGLQTPPRDNVKILATVAEALESLGASQPGEHVIQARNYLAVTTLACPSPIRAADCARLLGACDKLGLDVEWAPCPVPGPKRQLHRVQGPPGADYSYYHYAAREIFSPRRGQFLKGWAYDVRPATDDSPYFYSFFRWKSLPLLRKAHGRHWLQRLEQGYVALVVALGEAVVAGAALILLPLLWLRRRASRARGRLATGTYFLLLGAAFMLVEMALILKFTKFLGDPILSAGGVLGAFLVLSGLGSVVAGRLVRSPARAITGATLGIGALAVAYAFGLDGAFSVAASWPTAARFALSAVLAAPAAFLMGWPFPSGLSCLRRGESALVPWAWGANGFASVAATPLAVLLAVAAGFSSVLLLAAVLYGCAGLLAWRLPGARPAGGRDGQSPSTTSGNRSS